MDDKEKNNQNKAENFHLSIATRKNFIEGMV